VAEVPLVQQLKDSPVFNMHNFKKILDLVGGMVDQNGMEISEYTQIYREIVKLFKYFGKGLVIAFKECNDKADSVDTNVALLSEIKGQQINTIEEMLQFEHENGLLFLNGGNYNAQLKKFDSDVLKNNKDKLYYYVSTGWVIIRGAWLFDFLSQVFKHSREEPRDKTLSTCAKEAYDVGLKIRHPWVVQRLVQVGFNAVNYREVFEKMICEEQSEVQGRKYSIEDIYIDFEECEKSCDKIAKHIWKDFKDKGFEEIP